MAVAPINTSLNTQPVAPLAAVPAPTKADKAKMATLPPMAALAAPVDALLPEDITTEGINRYWGLRGSELVSTSITQTWTDQAIKCYLTCADCDSCSIPKGNYTFACQMATVVPALLTTIGTPDTDRIEKMVPVLDRF